MFDAVRNSKRIVQVILMLIILPFAFWGVESYVRDAGTGIDLARVGDSKISVAEFEQALREQQDQMRATLGDDYKPALFETPEARRAVLDGIVQQRLLRLAAHDAKLSVSDDMLREVILGIPALQVGGQFSRLRYEEALRSQNLSQAGFEARLRQDLAVQQIASAVADGAIATRAEAGIWSALQAEERELITTVVRTDAYVAQIKPDEQAVKAHYEASRAAFEIPEQVKAEYVILNQAALLDQVSVPEEEVRGAYERNAHRYLQAEERRASHILIQAAKDAPAEEIKAARARIDDIAAKLRQNPGDFARLAKEHSQDSGSAANGGDLGFFPRGAMVKPFEDAAFALKEGQISDVVQSEFGFHIIKVTGVKGATGRKYEEVRDELAAELKRQAASRKFAEIAEAFNNIVFEQADSLKPAAEKFKLPVRQSDWIRKGQPASGELTSEKLIQALFSDDAIGHKRNTEAVEIAPGVLASARVVDHRPASVKPLESVRKEIEQTLIRREASARAQKEGADKLASLVKGEKLDLSWSAPRAYKRAGEPGLSPEALRAAFKLAPGELPAYVGGALPDGGYAIYKVLSIKPQEKRDEAGVAALRGQLGRAVSEAEFGAFVASLRARYGVEINQGLLERKDR